MIVLKIIIIILLLLFIVIIICLVFDLPPFKIKKYPDYYVNWEYGVFETSEGEYLIQERRIEKDEKTHEDLFVSGWHLLERHQAKESATESYNLRIKRQKETIKQIL